MKQFIKILWNGVCLFFVALFTLICSLLIFGIICVIFNVIFNVEKWPVVLLGGIMAIVFLLVILISMFFFDYIKHRIELKRIEKQIAELDNTGLVQRESYRATRAFVIDEACLSYFIELNDKRVLFLSGQYLFYYEMCFPCAEFEIWRHRLEKHVLKIICNGTVIELETNIPPFTTEEYNQNRVPQDGDIIANRSYDELKAERLNSVAKRD